MSEEREQDLPQPESEVIPPVEEPHGEESQPLSTESPRDPVAEIEEWWAREIHGSVLGRYTEAFNHVMGAVDRLKARFRQ